jgi:hypothetical protein
MTSTRAESGPVPCQPRRSSVSIGAAAACRPHLTSALSRFGPCPRLREWDSRRQRRATIRANHGTTHVTHDSRAIPRFPFGPQGRWPCNHRPEVSSVLLLFRAVTTGRRDRLSRCRDPWPVSLNNPAETRPSFRLSRPGSVRVPDAVPSTQRGLSISMLHSPRPWDGLADWTQRLTPCFMMGHQEVLLETRV